MPYKFEYTNKKIPKELDKRVKLSDGQKRLIKEMYNSGEYSQRKLAIEFGVSRRLIQFIIDPEKLEQNKIKRLERGGSSVYYEKDKNSEAMKKHRLYKKSIEGKLV